MNENEKIARKFLAHYINTATDTALATYVRIGDDLEEYTVELSANVEKKKNIIGETSINVTGYEKTGSVEPYIARKGSTLFLRLQEIIDKSLVLDDCNVDVVEVKLWEESKSGEFSAIKELAVIEPTSYGGDNTSYQIPFNLHYTGNKIFGEFNPKTKTFTPETTA